METVKHIKLLAKFANRPLYTKSNFLCFDWDESGWDGANVLVDVETHDVFLARWQENYHNGDHYDYNKHRLTSEEAHQVLQKLLKKYEKFALEHAKIEVINDLAKQKLEAYLLGEK